MEKEIEKEKTSFTVTNEQGDEIKCEVLFTFESDETGKNYIVYTDNSLDEDKNVKVFASIFDPNKENSALLPIDTEKEWEVIANILKSLQESKQ